MKSQKPAPALSAIKRSFLLLALLAGGQAMAGPAGSVINLSGPLMAKKANGEIVVLGQDSQVEEGDTLITERSTYARIKFVDGGLITLRPNTEFRISKYAYDADKASGNGAALNLLKGGLRAVTGAIGKKDPESYSVQTPTATLGIRGTAYGMQFCQGDCVNLRPGQTLPNGLHVDVSEGMIVLTNNGGQTPFAAGQFGYVRDPMTPPVQVPMEQGFRIPTPENIQNTRNPVNNNAGCVVR